MKNMAVGRSTLSESNNSRGDRKSSRRRICLIDFGGCEPAAGGVRGRGYLCNRLNTYSIQIRIVVKNLPCLRVQFCGGRYPSMTAMDDRNSCSQIGMRYCNIVATLQSSYLPKDKPF